MSITAEWPSDSTLPACLRLLLDDPFYRPACACVQTALFLAASGSCVPPPLCACVRSSLQAGPPAPRCCMPLPDRLFPASAPCCMTLRAGCPCSLPGVRALVPHAHVPERGHRTSTWQTGCARLACLSALLPQAAACPCLQTGFSRPNAEDKYNYELRRRSLRATWVPSSEAQIRR